MTATPAEKRALAQRERILTAAQKCFIERGFHAASMANIADAADMSPGLIYRYFASKSEIVLAIIEQQLQLAREEMQQLDGRRDLALQIARSFGDAASTAQRQTHPALFLEISAEASRDAVIGAAVRSSDQVLDAEFHAWLGRTKHEGGLGIAASRTELVALLLQCLWEGMKVREARQPDFDHALLQAALQEFLPALLTPADVV